MAALRASEVVYVDRKPLDRTCRRASNSAQPSVACSVSGWMGLSWRESVARLVQPRSTCGKGGGGRAGRQAGREPQDQGTDLKVLTWRDAVGEERNTAATRCTAARCDCSRAALAPLAPRVHTYLWGHSLELVAVQLQQLQALQAAQLWGQGLPQ